MRCQPRKARRPPARVGGRPQWRCQATAVGPSAPMIQQICCRAVGRAAILAAVPSPSALPVGTVTLLFCDVEGSTALARRLGDDWLEVLAAQRNLLRGAVAAQGGIELGTEGDGTRAVFVRARDAVVAAAEAQRALAAHNWPPGGSLRVRMGLHTGEPELMAEGYEGLDMHRAARVMAAGHGGQVLLSGSVRETLGERLPAGVAVRELGLYVLADLPRPEHLFQLDVEGLPVEFPAPSARPARRAARGTGPAAGTGHVGAGEPRKASRVAAEGRVGDAAAGPQQADAAGGAVLAPARRSKPSRWDAMSRSHSCSVSSRPLRTGPAACSSRARRGSARRRSGSSASTR